ncbi:hypothetical protein VC83_09496 [Pseudogymnoascus destructans]|uniref:Uncharacterized protein n=2 Tax=Pseudogymnoascus destructans TaxID=655981 RepID=L8G3Z5_PSED2|nr:uncharacterized protein VC83_09496 [Pseudogymnoascus destructans]ELR07867.1 hypothetical protein GMDG_02749 [Pseudogymnoascus destructans 20631-21]OAF54243.1 hypothetical protein VC83_09496 [Pseudogymnoascus destructans]
MEVGLMLNASPDDGDQPRPLLTGEAAIRSRTPWDAGGYSLPVNHDLDTTISKHIHHHDSSLESSQTYPTKHSLSDSRGSLSSLASASTSTHSRLSSASTVGGFQVFNNFTDSSKLSDSTLDWTSILANSATLSPASPATFSFHHYPPSPRAELIHVLAQIAEGRFMDADSTLEEHYRDSEMADVDARATSATSEQPALSRTASPTDALLIKRHTPLTPQESETAGSVSAQPHPSGEENIAPWKYQSRAQLDRLNSFPPSESRREFESHSGRFAMESRRHKRAFSEPHIQGQSGASFGQPTSDMLARYRRSEPTPPSSQHPENESPQAETLDDALHLGSQYTPPLQDLHSTCMFKEGCDTGSQPRKAVSHIFGRNKMCTRLIPEHVWVRYCRKHYQRSRYREPKNWPRCQCDLVQKQIQRLEEWSAENERREEGGVVRSWGLAVRKREQKRLDDLALSKARGGRGNPYVGNYEDVDPSAPATAVPLWLRSLCGKTYSTLDIRDIFNRVHQELLNSPSPVFPDIEILPHITLDGDESESPMRYGGRRKTPTTSHQRSRSMGGALPPPLDSFPEDLQFNTAPRSRSNSNFENQDGPLHHKRKRRDCSPEDADAELTAQSQRLRLNVTTGAYEAHPSILSASSSASDVFQTHGPYRSPLRTPPALTPSLQSLPSILASDGPAPTRYPLRSSSTMLLAAPDNGHRRSRSDVNGFPFPEQPVMVSHMRSYFGAGYQFPENHGHSSHHNQPHHHNHSHQGMQEGQRYPSANVAFPRGGHSRHQSTPVGPGLGLTQPGAMPLPPPLVRGEEKFGGVLVSRGVREVENYEKHAR